VSGAPSHRVSEGEREGFGLLELHSPAGLVASYAPGAGMVCCSLRHRGVELLGQRKGLRAYASGGSTMGIPILHPWANRLARWGYAVGDVRVDLPSGSPLVHDDGRGLPIHGLVAGCPHWRVRKCDAASDGARLVAELDAAARPELLALFPFPHVLRMEVVLRDSTLEITTVLRATGDRAVPVAFGYHPYFRLPELPRPQWEVEVPVRRRMLLDERFLPTGRSEPVRIEPSPLGERIFDDLFTELEPAPVFALSGGGRRLEVAFGEAYRIAVVYAPAADDVVCFEPMTAPTNPFEGGAELARVEPGRELRAHFRIRVT
jgi:aldose 1-epimerase